MTSTLEETSGNRAEAARRLDMDRGNLHHMRGSYRPLRTRCDVRPQAESPCHGLDRSVTVLAFLP
jgi:hypothetical protein